MILLALGANLASAAGAPPQTLKTAIAQLEAQAQLRGLSVSRLYRSAAWPDPDGQAYGNCCVAARTEIGPEALLTACHIIEDRFGRRREGRWASRTLDIDLIDYDGTIRPAPGGSESGPPESALILPHPRCHDRAFVLLPLRDVAAGWIHPVSGRSIASLIAALPDGQACHPVPWEDPWEAGAYAPA